MLFLALAGRHPFVRGHHLQTLFAKVEEDAPRVSSLVEGVPDDLDALVAALLEREPETRAGASAIRAWLDGSSEAIGAALTSPEPPFVGRAREQEILAAELARVAAGEPRHVLVRGPSGIGKTTLMRRFAEQLEQSGRAVVLAARCYDARAARRGRARR